MSLDILNVSITRGQNCVIKDVSFNVQAGEVVSIVGPNGSGKSTLIAAISGELKCQSGWIRLNDKKLSQWTFKELAQQRAVLMQKSSLSFPFKVIDVVMMGRSVFNQGIATKADIMIAEKALVEVGLIEMFNRSYTELSGGEQQRVHLARALCQISIETEENKISPTPTRFLLLDEPTASQDLAAQNLVLSSARAQSRIGVGVLCVLHDLNQTAQYSDRVILIHQGRIIANGPPRDVLTSEVLTDIYRTEITVIEHEGYPHPIIMSPAAVG